MKFEQKSGAFSNYFNRNTKTASSNEGNLRLLDFSLLEPHENNFYGMRDIEQLARAMAISGQVDPLTVMESESNPGRYIILSGERRWRAVRKRFERGEITDKRIPCLIVDEPQADEDFSVNQKINLRIVTANSQRVKLASERLKEIETLEPMAKIEYEKAVKKGSYSGTFRTYFAENYLGISSSGLQRLYSLKKLDKSVIKCLDAEIISYSVADELAKHPASIQQEFISRVSDGTIESTKKAFIDMITPSSKEEEESMASAETEDAHPADDYVAEDPVPEVEEYPAAGDYEKKPDEDASSDSDEDVDNSESIQEKGSVAEDVQVAVSATQSAPSMPSDSLVNTMLDSPLVKATEKSGIDWIEALLISTRDAVQKLADEASSIGDDKSASLWRLRSSSIDVVLANIRKD